MYPYGNPNWGLPPGAPGSPGLPQWMTNQYQRWSEARSSTRGRDDPLPQVRPVPWKAKSPLVAFETNLFGGYGITQEHYEAGLDNWLFEVLDKSDAPIDGERLVLGNLVINSDELTRSVMTPNIWLDTQDNRLSEQERSAFLARRYLLVPFNSGNITFVNIVFDRALNHVYTFDGYEGGDVEARHEAAVAALRRLTSTSDLMTFPKMGNNIIKSIDITRGDKAISGYLTLEATRYFLREFQRTPRGVKDPDWKSSRHYHGKATEANVRRLWRDLIANHCDIDLSKVKVEQDEVKVKVEKGTVRIKREDDGDSSDDNTFAGSWAA